MKTYEILTKLAKETISEPQIIPLVLIGVSLGVVECYIKPAIQDLAHKIMDRTVEPWESEFFDHDK